MEGFIFFVILVVFSLLRGGAKGKRQPQAPPMRPQRPTLEAGPEPSGPAPAARPARRTIFDEAIYMFPKQRIAPDPAPVKRQEPVAADPVVMREEPQKAPGHVPKCRVRGLLQDRDELARGIILAEVLGPPLSKRKDRGFIR
jgi:hypothetical protein